MELETEAFFHAVEAHLRGPAAARHDARRLIDEFLEESALGETAGIQFLLANPELLASFFQNADLLGSDSSGALRLIGIIRGAFDRAWEMDAGI